MPLKKNYAYITLLTNDWYANGVIILLESLRMVRSNYPLVCMFTDKVSVEVRDRLSSLGVIMREIEPIPMPERIYKQNKLVNADQTETWKDVFAKLAVFDIMDYDKLIFCDADLLFLKNVDHCFDKPHMTAALDGEYCNLWKNIPHFNSGFFVVEPGVTKTADLLSFLDTCEIKPNVPGQAFADQDLLNMYFSDWVDKADLHLNKYYNVFPLHVVSACEDDILTNAYFMHFVGTKPWASKSISEHLGISNEINIAYGTSVFVEMNTAAMCLMPYELAMAILELSAQANGKIDWGDAKMKNRLERTAIIMSINFFKDADSGKKWLSRASASLSADDVSLVNGLINRLEMSKKYCPLFSDLLVMLSAQRYDSSSIRLFSLTWAFNVWYSNSAQYACEKILSKLTQSDYLLAAVYK